MHQVLFVCTANVFRSLTAEYAVRQLLANRNGFHVSSAGTDNRWYEVPPYITSYLATRGFDVRRHRRRTLTADMLHPAVTVIAMSSDRQEHIARQSGRHDVPPPDIGPVRHRPLLHPPPHPRQVPRRLLHLTAIQQPEQVPEPRESH
jgi:protein-tyrosine-phosphatase